MSDFFRTRMGHTFFEVTLPRIATELARIADALERAVAVAERLAPPPGEQPQAEEPRR